MSKLLRLELRRWGNLPLPRGFLSMDQTQEVSQQLTTVDGWNPAITSWGKGSLSHYLPGFISLYIPRWCRISAISSNPNNVGSDSISYRGSTAFRRWLGRWMLSPWNLSATMQVARLCPENPLKRSACMLFQSWFLHRKRVQDHFQQTYWNRKYWHIKHSIWKTRLDSMVKSKGIQKSPQFWPAWKQTWTGQ